MFILSTTDYPNSSCRNLTSVRIHGCPASGIAAVDYRRAAGLPEEPSAIITLPALEFADEETARRLPLDKGADFCLRDQFGELPGWCVSQGIGARCRICYAYCQDAWRTPHVDPADLAAFLREPSPATMERLYRGALAIHEAHVAEMEREAAEKLAAELAAQQAITDARALLADELAKLTARAEKAEEKAAYWQAEAERVEEDAEVDA